jgi:hypothetical protein
VKTDSPLTLPSRGKGRIKEKLILDYAAGKDRNYYNYMI